MMIPPKGFEGWKVWTVGDDIAWIKPDENGQLARDQSGSGIFRRRARHVAENESQRHGHAFEKHHLHQRRFDAGRRRVVGRLTDEPPAECLDWQGNRWTPEIGEGDRAQSRSSECALYRARFAMPVDRSRTGKIPKACRSAPFIFGGDARPPCPLVYQAFNWSAGVYIGATMGSETTAAAAGAVGKVRRDPMAMLPFCGYHMGDYFRHWLRCSAALSVTPQHFPCELVPQRR